MYQQLWGYKVEWKSVSRGTGGKKVEYHWYRVMFPHVSFHNPSVVWIVKSRRLQWAGHVTRVGKIRNTYYRILMGKPLGKCPFGRPRRRLEDNIKVDVKG
jgi:hypothetical protein